MMLVTTTSSFEGYRIKEYKGIVRGITKTSDYGLEYPREFDLEKLKRWAYSEKEYEGSTEVYEQARQDAYDLLVENAMEIGANAVIGMCYDTSEITSQEHSRSFCFETEVLCYGTAVVIEPI